MILNGGGFNISKSGLYINVSFGESIISTNNKPNNADQKVTNIGFQSQISYISTSDRGGSSGVNINKVKDLTIYTCPTVANEKITVYLEALSAIEDKYILELLNSSGESIKKYEYNNLNTNFDINLGEISDGIYLIRFFNETQKSYFSTKKFLKISSSSTNSINCNR